MKRMNVKFFSAKGIFSGKGINMDNGQELEEAWKIQGILWWDVDNISVREGEVEGLQIGQQLRLKALEVVW